jgi:arylsulfatase A-like enzyme
MWLATALAVASKQPNVLFVVVDDLAPTLSTYGYPVITPNIERLKKISTQFQSAYVSVAVCAPSRTAFLTGLRPDTTQVWTIGPFFRNTSRGQGLNVVTLPQMFKQAGYNVTGVGKIFHPGTPSGGLSSSEGGGDMCPSLSWNNNCTWGAAGATSLGSWTEPHFFCDQYQACHCSKTKMSKHNHNANDSFSTRYTNDTVQSPAMQQWPCSKNSWPSCGTGCVQPQSCIDCFIKAG